MKHTEIICVIDRSGSMTSIKKSAIDGFNKFVNSQKELDGKANITTVLFDDQYDVIHDNIEIDKIELLNDGTYVPRGMTALYDAIGKAINTVHGRINKEMSEPSNVICAILTDGDENASTEYNQKTIHSLIKEMTDDYNWEFAFLGANQDSFAAARSLYIPKGNTIQFAANLEDTNVAYAKMSMGMTKMRSVSNYTKGTLFEDED